MSVKPVKQQFNGGELSPWLYGRTDIAKYGQTAKLCRNFIPLTEGSLKRRGGTRFVAKTPEDEGVLFQVSALPRDAEILINNEKQKSLKVARGDTVFYEVKADGYVASSGEVKVVDDCAIQVVLVSVCQRKTLCIVATPEEATVKIAGCERTFYEGLQNETVAYSVFYNGYVLQKGSVLLNGNKIINVVLNLETESGSSYGTWGDPVAFVACTAYGCLSVNKKCFMILFENGYLPILFDAQKIAPESSDIDESLFITTAQSGYNSLVLDKNNNMVPAVIRDNHQAVLYSDLSGNVIAGFTKAEMLFVGWQVDDNGYCATVYQNYDAVISGKVIKVYYKDELVWTMKGRSNG